MSETIGEMILPGTYIEVRAEGLIGVGGISVGNIGVVGTANRGPLGEVEVLGSYSEALNVFGRYDPFKKPATGNHPLSLTRTLEQVFKGGGSTVYAVRISSTKVKDMKSRKWNVQGEGEGDNPTTLFTLTAKTPGSWANNMTATLATSQTPEGELATIEIVYGRIKESFEGSNADELAKEIEDGSNLVEVRDLAEGEELVPKQLSDVEKEGGPDGANVSKTEVTAGLDKLKNQTVNIVVIGGMDAGEVSSEAAAHLEATENDGRERMAVLGAAKDDLSKIAGITNHRIILVTPGIKADDAAVKNPSKREVRFPASYSAALVAGRLSTLATHVSLTNKAVPAGDLTTEYSRAKQKQALGKRLLVLQKNPDVRVLKGITTDDGAFQQISVRRTVDFAKAGVRKGSNPYIGRLNNSRVRAALKATLDGFLSSMILSEQLQSYTLDVTATRAQEIRGEAVVSMTLRPTFSIDFIRVIMNLE